MSKPTEHRFVNWIDGMKVNSKHFIQDQLATIDLARDASSRFVSPINYGLLLPEFGKHSSLQSTCSVEANGTLNVLVNYCRAVTANGTLIEVLPHFPLKAQFSIEKELAAAHSAHHYFIVMVADAFHPIPFGVPDPNEIPARQPYLATALHIQFIKEDSLSTHHSAPVLLPIAKYILNRHQAEEDISFIPPCTAPLAYPDLADALEETIKFYTQTEQFTLNIIQKVHQKNQQNELALLMLELSERIQTFINYRFASLKWELAYRSPFHLYELNTSLARIIHSFLESRNGTGKEEMINYITEWCDLSQGQFDNAVTELLHLPYQHSDINKALSKIAEFAKTISLVLSKLAKLDYIGKKKETNIFVKEEPVTETNTSGEAKPKVKRSFLAD